MKIVEQPCQENNFLGDHAELMLSSLFRLTGRYLVDPLKRDMERYRALFEAPFCVVSHNTDADPIFNYANQAALALFDMTWGAFTRMPSRLSADQQVREEREKLLETVARCGYIDDYQGIRISSSGKRFFVEDALVWNLTDERGHYLGQAAVLYKWSPI